MIDLFPHPRDLFFSRIEEKYSLPEMEKTKKMQKKTLLQRLNNRQFELITNLIGFAIMGLSLVDFTSKILVVLMVIATPAVFGYAVALILD